MIFAEYCAFVYMYHKNEHRRQIKKGTPFSFHFQYIYIYIALSEARKFALVPLHIHRKTCAPYGIVLLLSIMMFAYMGEREKEI